MTSKISEASKTGDLAAWTPANTNPIATLDTPFADPDLDLLRQKLNELILNGRR